MAIDHPKKDLIEDLLAKPVLARLGTANPDTLQPHVVPVWFLWDGESAWISAFTSTRKAKDVLANRKCAVLVEPAAGASQLQAVLLEGVAEIVSEPRDLVRTMALRIYTHYMGEEGVKAAEPQSWAVDPENMIIKLAPRKVFCW